MRYPESESSTLEFKREWPKNEQIVKTAIGFCNQYGGRIILGISDDRSVIGLSDSEIERALESVETSIYDACAPHIIPRVYAQRIGDKTLLVIEISEGMNKPYYRRSEGKQNGTYIRLGRHTLKATKEIIQELEWQTRGIDYERTPVYQATKDDLDLDRVQYFLNNRRNDGATKVNEQNLLSYSLITYDHSKCYPTVLGLLLFGRRPQNYFSEAMIICSHFQGVSGREAIATVDCEGDLFNQFKQAFAFIKERLYSSFTIKALKREQQLEIPEEAIREALLNIIVHRNYHIKAPSKIAIYDDRVEFFSPGQFPGPISIDNLKGGITYLRNSATCKVLREAGYIEKIGSGFITIFSSYDKAGLKSPTVVEGENYIKCTLPRSIAKIEKEDTNDCEAILEHIRTSGSATITDIAQLLSVSRTTAVRRLNDMIDKGLIKRVGQTKAVRYVAKE